MFFGDLFVQYAVDQYYIITKCMSVPLNVFLKKENLARQDQSEINFVQRIVFKVSAPTYFYVSLSATDLKRGGALFMPSRKVGQIT